MATIRRVLVTGSSGTIGTGLCQFLIQKGFDVVPVDWTANTWDSELNRRTLNLDLRSPANWKRLPSDIDAVVHLAANARVHELTLNPDGARDNILTTYNALEFCRTAHVKRFFFASSREAYGDNTAKKNREANVDITRTPSPYAASKIAGEALCHAYTRCYGIDHVIFRFSNVYGKFDDSIRVVPLFIRLARANEPLTVFGKTKAYDMTHIDDTVDAIHRALARFEKAKNRTFNVATGRAVRLADMAQWIKHELHSTSPIRFAPMRAGEIAFHRADISAAQKILGYSPKIHAREGLARAVEWYQKNRP